MQNSSAFFISLSVYNSQFFLFYHILGIFAVQVSLDAFILYVAMVHCQKNLWKLWGAVVLSLK